MTPSNAAASVSARSSRRRTIAARSGYAIPGIGARGNRHGCPIVHPMSTAAEPRPAALPLPGGRDGATVTLNPLLVARMVAPPALFHREEGRLATLKAHGFRVPRDQWLEIPAGALP